MIIWINGAFGSGKTTTAFELKRRLPNSFVYDPENFGYFIRRNAPESFSDGDFQDIPLWREMNYKALRMIAEQYGGTIIVPMTLVNLAYYDEIIGNLLADGVDVRHFILYVGRDELRRRLKKRTAFFLGRDTFALSSIDRCVEAFDTKITDVKIHTKNLSVDEIVEQIATLCGLTLSPDRKSKLGKLIYRAKIMIKHMR